MSRGTGSVLKRLYLFYRCSFCVGTFGSSLGRVWMSQSIKKYEIQDVSFNLPDFPLARSGAKQQQRRESQHPVEQSWLTRCLPEGPALSLSLFLPLTGIVCKHVKQ